MSECKPATIANPVDQASRLRELASPRYIEGNMKIAQDVPLKPTQPSASAIVDPCVVLISELPALHGGFQVAWHLAQQLSRPSLDGYSRRLGRSAIVDLSPAASRLPAHLRKLGGEASVASNARQPLWNNLTHGRGLAASPQQSSQSHDEFSNEPHIDIVAQPVGEFPTAEQLTRMCEQLLRSISGRRQEQPQLREAPLAGPQTVSANWQNIVFLSEVHGVPLDGSCWQAADMIVLLMPESEAYFEMALAGLQSRLAKTASSQRVVVAWKQSTALSTWRLPTSRTSRRCDVFELPNVETLNVAWPSDKIAFSAKQLASEQRLSKAAAMFADMLHQGKSA